MKKLRSYKCLLLLLSLIISSVAFAQPTRPDDGFTHAIPVDRNLLTIKRVPGVPLDSYLGELRSKNASIAERNGLLDIIEFTNEAAMEAAIPGLNALDAVARSGPTVLSGQGIYLTDRFIVRFLSAQARTDSAPIFNACGLQEIHALPYARDTYVYKRAQGPSYELYEVGQALLFGQFTPDCCTPPPGQPNLCTEGVYADIAVPDTVVYLDNACGDTSCATAAHHDYLGLLDTCDAWTKPVWPDTSPVLAILDSGIHNGDAEGDDHDLSDIACERLEVIGVVDFGSTLPESCLADSAPFDNWCDSCSETFRGWVDGDDEVTGPAGTHGIEMAFTAAATEDEDLRGVAPGTSILNVRRDDDPTRWELANALWWLGGGKVEFPTYPERLDETHRAQVINLSFSADFGDLPSEVCKPMSSPVADLECAPIGILKMEPVDFTLERLEAGTDGISENGVIVVAAMAKTAEGEVNDLAENAHTIAVGAVNGKGEPFRGDDDEIPTHDFAEYLELVAPLGDASDMTTLCTDCWSSDVSSDTDFVTFESSPAAAAVSGIAVLMLKSNPYLTAKQTRCLLNETAGDPQEWWTDGIATWGKKEYDCGFDADGKSKCVGNGLANACQAVQAAINCRPCFSTSPSGESVEVPCSTAESTLDPAKDDTCLCDEDGVLVP